MATYSYKHQEDLDKLLNQSTNYGDYKSAYTDKMNAIQDALANRQFSYDPNQDETYKQYEQSYTRMGQQAAEDTIGKVSARTGGLASSYATSAANQAYNTYMQQLADKIPELKQLAYNMYVDEGNSLNQQLNNYLNMDSNALNIYNTNLNSLINRAGLLMDDRTGDYNIYDTNLLRAMQQKENDRNYNLRLAELAAQQAALEAAKRNVVTTPKKQILAQDLNPKYSANKTVNKSVTDSGTGNVVSSANKTLNNYNKLNSMIRSMNIAGNGQAMAQASTWISNAQKSGDISKIQADALRKMYGL